MYVCSIDRLIEDIDRVRKSYLDSHPDWNVMQNLTDILIRAQDIKYEMNLVDDVEDKNKKKKNTNKKNRYTNETSSFTDFRVAPRKCDTESKSGDDRSQSQRINTKIERVIRDFSACAPATRTLTHTHPHVLHTQIR